MNDSQFKYNSLRYQVHFGKGKSQNIDSIIPTGEKVFVIVEERNKHLYDLLSTKLGAEKVFLFSKVIQHVPIALVEEATKAFEQSGCQWIVSIGGGSAIGLAKAIALRADALLIAVPTTYAGSEMTNIWGITGEDGNKTTGRDNRVMARHIVYDPELTITLPTQLAVTSAINALAHLVEAAYSPDGNPVTYQSSIYGIKQMFAGLEKVANDGKLTEKSNHLFLEAAFLAGKGLCEVPMSLHHKTAHVLGGTYNLEHSHVHTVMLSFVLEYQWPALSKQVQEDFQKYMNNEYPPQAIIEVIREMDAPDSLEKIGYQKEEISRTVSIMLRNPYENVRPLVEEELKQLLTNAFEGTLKGQTKK